MTASISQRSCEYSLMILKGNIYHFPSLKLSMTRGHSGNIPHFRDRASAPTFEDSRSSDSVTPHSGEAESVRASRSHEIAATLSPIKAHSVTIRKKERTTNASLSLSLVVRGRLWLVRWNIHSARASARAARPLTPLFMIKNQIKSAEDGRKRSNGMK